jgi:hypothetical protein
MFTNVIYLLVPLVHGAKTWAFLPGNFCQLGPTSKRRLRAIDVTNFRIQ